MYTLYLLFNIVHHSSHVNKYEANKLINCPSAGRLVGLIVLIFQKSGNLHILLLTEHLIFLRVLWQELFSVLVTVLLEPPMRHFAA